MDDITKTYSNGDITIVWKPSACIHSTLCWKGLPRVFNPRAKPWVNQNGAVTESIIQQVDKCPSKALSYYRNSENPAAESISTEGIVEIMPNGPLMVYGNIEVKYGNGQTEQKNKVTAFCRCGLSANKPYCDGTHVKAGFKG